MEQTTLSGDEWEDGKYVLFGKGDRLAINLRKSMVQALGLKPRDEVKIYVKKVRENVAKVRDQPKNPFNKTPEIGDAGKPNAADSEVISY
jgi:hypothetical protein|tara:strand:- start:1980 stop:2249 length:270 start_codon:yes stop_codon:yes gene_type:complete